MDVLVCGHGVGWAHRQLLPARPVEGSGAVGQWREKPKKHVCPVFVHAAHLTKKAKRGHQALGLHGAF